MSVIFGKVGSELETAHQRDLIRKIFYGERKFAWLPARTVIGTWIWLEYYYVYFSGELNWDSSRLRLLPYSEQRAFGDNIFLDRNFANVDCYHRNEQMDKRAIELYLSNHTFFN